MVAIPAPRRGKTLEMPYKILVLRADPDFEAMKRKQPSYEFTGRTFFENPANQGPYSTVPNIR